MGIRDPGLKIRVYPMIKDLSWLKISDVFAPNIRQISWNKVIIYPKFYIRMVLQKHKLSRNILQDIRKRPTIKKKTKFSFKKVLYRYPVLR
jgi:hypothetical protein